MLSICKGSKVRVNNDLLIPVWFTTPAPALWFASYNCSLLLSSFMSFVHLTVTLFQAGCTLLYCKTIKALYSSLSTYHLVFEPYFHFPLGFSKLN